MAVCARVIPMNLIVQRKVDDIIALIPLKLDGVLVETRMIRANGGVLLQFFLETSDTSYDLSKDAKELAMSVITKAERWGWLKN